jgi:leucyl aminopeptidase
LPASTPSFSASSVSPTDVAVDTLVLPIFEGPQAGPGVKEVARALGADLMGACTDNGIRGKAGQSLAVPTMGRISARSVLLVGLGKRPAAKTDAIRQAAGKIAGRLRDVRSVATTLGQVGRSAEGSAAAVVEGMLMGGYRFDRYKSKADDDRSGPSEVALLGKAADTRKVKSAISRALTIADAVNLARDFVNTPSADAVPEVMAGHAKAIARKAGLKVKVWAPAELQKGGFGGILGVGQGSANPPRLVELSYDGGRAGAAPIVIVGKGITFDSGGLSIKDAKNMEWMKVDKGGASAMLATMKAISTLKVKANVIALLPFAENMPSGSAQRPGDIITHRNGKTSEVLNTDAEGRLILADALSLAVERKPAVIIDAATLTGACMVALGPEVSGVFGNDKALVKEVLAAGESVGEPSWELPLFDGYRKLIESPVADIKNIGGPYGGAITAALFLKEFVGETPWVHIDIAGPAWTDGGNALGPKGATGIPVRTLVEFISGRAARR